MSVNKSWDYQIFNDLPNNITEFGSLGVSDIDGDLRLEMVMSTNDGMIWYRPMTFEYGVIVNFPSHIGIALEDIDRDGRLEILTAERFPGQPERYALVWLKRGARSEDIWTKFVIDPHFEGGPHDIVVGDVDGDGKSEMVAISCYSETPGIFLYKPGKDITQPWTKSAVQEGIFTEGLNLGDLDGDGKLEIVCGPDWEPYAGCWPIQRTLAAPYLCPQLSRDVPYRFDGYYRQWPPRRGHHRFRNTWMAFSRGSKTAWWKTRPIHGWNTAWKTA